MVIVSGNGGQQLLSLLQQKTGQSRPKTEAEQAALDKAQERNAKAQDALNTMKQATDAMRDQRKSAAAAKVQRLKQELQNLRQFSGGDPKAIARQAARIARELGMAAKEYAAAGGGGQALGATGAGSATSAQGQSAGDAEETQTAEAVQAIAADGDEVSAEAEGNPADAQAAEAKAAQLAADAEQAENAPKTEEEKRQEFTDALNGDIAERQKKAAEKKADADFANEVRSLHRQAKALLEQQRRRAEQQGDEEGMDDLAREVAQAGRDIDSALSGSGGGGFPLNILV